MRAAVAGLALLLGMMVHAPAALAAKTAAETLDAFHKALRENQPDRVLALLAKDAVLFEQGFAEATRDEWVRKQLGPAIAFARDTERRVLSRQSGSARGLVWIASTTQTVIDAGGRQVVLEGAETAVLRREGEDWSIVHLHWSAHEADSAQANNQP